MTIRKKTKDYISKICAEKDFVPRGLFEINKYFRMYGPIYFKFKREGGVIIGISQNFRYGSIVTSGKNQKELDKNIEDAILTSFEIPSAYAKEASIKKIEENKNKVYALA